MCWLSLFVCSPNCKHADYCMQRGGRTVKLSREIANLKYNFFISKCNNNSKIIANSKDNFKVEHIHTTILGVMENSFVTFVKKPTGAAFV